MNIKTFTLVFTLMLFPSIALAGFEKCHDGQGNIVSKRHPQAQCVYFSDQTTGTAAHDRVQALYKRVPPHYIKWAGEPVEMTDIEKAAKDTKLIRDSKLREANSVSAETEELLEFLGKTKAEYIQFREDKRGLR